MKYRHNGRPNRTSRKSRKMADRRVQHIKDQLRRKAIERGVVEVVDALFRLAAKQL